MPVGQGELFRQLGYEAFFEPEMLIESRQYCSVRLQATSKAFALRYNL